MTTVEDRPAVPIPAPAGATAAWRQVIALPLIVLAVAAGLAFVWYSAPSLLLLFAGILFASLLDACTRGLGSVLPLPRRVRYALVVLILGSAAVVVAAWAIVRLPGQVHALIDVMDAQLTVLERELAGFGIELFGPGGRQGLTQFLNDPGRLFGHVHSAVSGAYVVIINTIVVVCLGLFFAGQPAAYREGALILMPPAARSRVRMAMNEMGQVMRSWLLGQLLRIVIVAIVATLSFDLLGLPGAWLLGLQAGAANFIPYLGPLIAAFPVALVAMPLGLPTLAWAMILYVAIQTIDGFVIAPLIQKGSLDLAPAWTLFAIIVFGAMFGGLGIALAAPVLGLARIAVLRFYVEDWLGGRAEA
ncbi:MAG: AI-2E family transporter [Proteobacteria bacterium]|nr:AI-2E family transporter [Pseudomonadota bacterium]